MNCPGETARRTSIAGRIGFLHQLCLLHHHDGVGAARHHAAGGDGRRRACADFDRGRMPAGDDFRVQAQAARCCVAGVQTVRCPQGKPVDAGAIEGRRVNGCSHVMRQHAAERGRQCDRLGCERRQIEMALETQFRLFGRHHFKELLLGGGAPDGGKKLGCHGSILTATWAPGG